MRVLGDDGGATCADPNEALSRATLLAQLTNGAAGPGIRPVIADSRVVKGQLLDHQDLLPRRAGGLPGVRRRPQDRRRGERLTMEDLRARIADLMPAARDELAELVAIRSVADPRQFPPEECERAAQWVLDGSPTLGFADARLERDRGRQQGRRRVAAVRRPGRPDRAALRPLRRAAAARRRRLAHAAVRADRGRRPLVRPRGRRLQGQHPHAPHGAARARATTCR